MKKITMYALMVLLAAVAYSCSDGGDGDDNPPVYFTYGGHSYQVIKERKAWVEAAADAVAKGGYLVEIGSSAEQAAVYQGIVNAGVSATYVQVTDGGGAAYVWIGATDMAQEGKWLWNGKNVTGGGTLFWTGSNTGVPSNNSYVNWGGKAAGQYNEPDNFTDSQYSPNGQNAAAIGLAKWPAGIPAELGKAGEWNDIASTNRIYYVIEFDTIQE